MTPPLSRRLIRRRTKGWRKPDGAICITRPGRWGNHYKIGRPIYHVTGGFVTPRTAAEAVLDELRGRDLLCFCGLCAPCHGDVLIVAANAPA